MNNIRLKIAIALIAGLAFAANANAVTRTVDCDKGQTIQSAIGKGQGSAEQLVINVSGLCEGDVLIRRDDVTINGNNSATISGTISLQAVNRITIERITVTGPGYAIAASGSNNVALNYVIATGNQGWVAIFAVSNSSLNINNSNISSNVQGGIFAGLSSSLVTGGNTVINNNPGMGVHVTIGSSAFIEDGTTIQGNEFGIFVDKHSIVDLENADVSNNTNIGIVISRDSAATLRTGNTVAGNANSGVSCNDTESSYSNDGVQVADNVYCTGFDQVAPEPE